jgi:hypothetical protein
MAVLISILSPMLNFNYVEVHNIHAKFHDFQRHQEYRLRHLIGSKVFQATLVVISRFGSSAEAKIESRSYDPNAYATAKY